MTHLIVINRNRHNAPTGFTELPILTSGTLNNPFQPGRLPKMLREQTQRFAPYTRTPQEHDALGRVQTSAGITDPHHGLIIHRLYLRWCCDTDNNTGLIIKQLSQKHRAGQPHALICRCVTTIWNPTQPDPPEPCHAVTIAHAILGYSRRHT